jgi:AcrR family transcriptional regulator
MTTPETLRERKQRRTRDGIIESAMALFDERGFDGVTVNEIAERAEIGRTTFFRYFSDKQEVLFAEDDALLSVLTTAVDKAARRVAPIGDNLDAALAVVRAGLHALAEVIVSQAAPWLSLRERLMRENPALNARNLLKERRYLQTSAEQLVAHGSTAETAALAAGVAAACFLTARITTAADPGRLAEDVDAAFSRIAKLGVGLTPGQTPAE